MTRRRRDAVRVTVLVVVIAAIAAAAVAVIRSDDEAAAAAGAAWSRVDGPATSVGGATLYTTCRDRERLWLTVGPDGEPVGPVTIDPSPCSS